MAAPAVLIAVPVEKEQAKAIPSPRKMAAVAPRGANWFSQALLEMRSTRPKRRANLGRLDGKAEFPIVLAQDLRAAAFSQMQREAAEGGRNAATGVGREQSGENGGRHDACARGD